MYIADESDDRVYSYNMPDAIDARLATLTLSACLPIPRIARVLGKLRDNERLLVDLYTNGRFEMALLDEKSATLADRRGALERERARLVADAEPGCDPEMLRERMPEALAFVREWVRTGRRGRVGAARSRHSRRKHRGRVAARLEIRVEVPLIKAFERRHYVTIEQTSAALFQDDMTLRVPLVVRAQLPRLERRRAGEARVTGGGRQEDGREPCAG